MQVRDGIPALALLINHSDDEVVQHACWAMSFLSNGREASVQVGEARWRLGRPHAWAPHLARPCRQAFIGSGCFPRVVELLVHPKDTVRRAVEPGAPCRVMHREVVGAA